MTHDADTPVSPGGEARPRSPRRSSPALVQRRIRVIHLYVSMLFAPSLLFFAVTGALQLFDLHETKPGRAFEPPAVLQELGMVHKKQVFALPRKRAAPPPTVNPDGAAIAAPAAVAPASGGRQDGWTVPALRIFFLFASVGLFVSTGLGLWVGFQQERHRRAAVGLLLIGAAVPILLAAL